jgi:hypothetical protein
MTKSNQNQVTLSGSLAPFNLLCMPSAYQAKKFRVAHYGKPRWRSTAFHDDGHPITQKIAKKIRKGKRAVR